MFEVRVTLNFSAAHFLKDYPGNCARLHGHNWIVIVAVRANELDSLGFVIDFRELKKDAQAIIEEIDHSLINEHKDFIEANPSSENIAKWIFNRLKNKVNDTRCSLHSIEVGETPSSSVIYYENL
jgi:6-pyruvoyltetrahydropterin/6-carboxytetrahydropterin synthase